MGGGAEDGGAEGATGDGGGRRIRDIECKSMDGGCGLEGGGDNLDFMGEGEPERVSTECAYTDEAGAFRLGPGH